MCPKISMQSDFPGFASKVHGRAVYEQEEWEVPEVDVVLCPLSFQRKDGFFFLEWGQLKKAISDSKFKNLSKQTQRILRKTPQAGSPIGSGK